MSWGRGVHNEKLKRSQRLALSGTAAAGQGSETEGGDEACLSLRVVQHPGDPEVKLRGQGHDARYDTVCYMHPDDHSRMLAHGAADRQAAADAGGHLHVNADQAGGGLFVYARTFPKVVLRARPHVH